MLSYDMHVHSNVSLDSNTPMADSIERALSLGLKGICFTDHLNLVYPEFTDKPDPNCYAEWAVSYKEIEKVRNLWGDQFDILHGMELAEITLDQNHAIECAKAPGIDYLLGASHTAKGHADFYYMTFPDQAFCHRITALYLDENIRLAKFNMADAIAHIGYPQRYMARQGFSIDLMDYEEQLRELFTIMVHTGQALELNTSGLRQEGFGQSFPNLPALKLYKALGGEMVTIGSDAHRAGDVASKFKEAGEFLCEAGFSHFTIFRQRKPEFIKL